LDLIPASELEQIAVIIPAIFALCPPKKLAIIEKTPLKETIFRMGGSKSELSSAPIPTVFHLFTLDGHHTPPMITVFPSSTGIIRFL
jgi:hypothetical protein